MLKPRFSIGTRDDLAWVSPRTGQKFSERKSNGLMRYDGIRFNDTFGARFRDAPKDHQGRPVVGVRRPAASGRIIVPDGEDAGNTGRGD